MKKYRIHRPKQSLTAKLKQRVLAGAAYLNVIYPGWFKKIDLDELDLASNSQCVIGQLYDENRAPIHGNGVVLQGEALGFYIESDRLKNTRYPMLTQLWKGVIRSLR